MSLTLLALVLVAVPLVFSPQALLIKEGLTNFLATAMLSVCLVGAAGRGSIMRARLVLRPQVIAFLGAAALSLVWGGLTFQGLAAAYQLVVLAMIYLLVSCMLDGEAQVRRYVVLMAVTAFLASAIGIFQVLVPGSFHTWATQGSAVSTLVNTNHAGGYLVTIVPLIVSLAMISDGRPARACFWVCALTAALGVIATQSRGAWVGLAVAMVLMTILLRWRPSREMQAVNWKRTLLGIGLALLLVLGPGELLLHGRGDSVIPRVTSIFDPNYPTNRFRLEWWAETIRMIRDHPLLGVGIGNFTLARFPYARHVDPRPTILLALEHPHNEYLFAAAEMGLVGFCVWLWMLVSVGRLAWSDLRGARTTSSYAMAAGFMAALAGAMVHSLWFYPWHSASSALNLWAMLGFLEVLHRAQGGPVGFSPPPDGGRSRRTGAAGFLAFALVAILWLGFYRLSFKPLMADWYLRRGMFEMTFGSPAKAMADLQSALAWDEFGFKTSMELGEVSLKAGKYREAIGHFQRAAGRAPGLPDAHANLGLSLYLAGMPAQAKAAYQQALRITPSYPVAHNNLGNIYSDEGNGEMAIEEYRNAIALNPRYANAHYNLAQALTRAGRLNEADASYRQAISIDANQPEAWYNLAAVSARLDRRDDAIAALTRAVNLDDHLIAIAREDADFQRLRHDERFRRLLSRP